MISPTTIHKTQLSHGKTELGFTLLELLVVMILIAVGTVSILPGLGGRASVWRIRESALNLQAVLELAHQLAVTRGQAVVFCIEKEGVFSVQVLPDMSERESENATPITYLRQCLARDVEIAVLDGFMDNGAQKCLCFWPDGCTSPATLELVELTHQQDRWHIQLHGNGKVEVEQINAGE